MTIYARIKKTFGAFALDVEFEAGNEALALLGASGCGKSMTLKCIAGVIRPDEGRIVVNGETLFDSEKKINISPQRRKVGLLFQNYALFPNMTVRRNVMSVLLSRRHRVTHSRESAEERFASLAEKFYIRGLENHYPAQLSGGQQQRVALARIMASDPSILMLDEPLSALDSYLRWQLEDELISTLEAFGGTTLYVSHNRDEAHRICGRVCVLEDGRSEDVRSIEALFREPGTLASSLLSGCKNYSRVRKIGEREVRALDWNVDLACAEPVGEDIRYIGVRAHYIAPCGGEGENVVACRVLHVTNDVFSTIVNMLPDGAPLGVDYAHIRMDMPKERAAIKTGDPLFVRIAPEDIMLLKA